MNNKRGAQRYIFVFQQFYKFRRNHLISNTMNQEVATSFNCQLSRDPFHGMNSNFQVVGVGFFDNGLRSWQKFSCLLFFIISQNDIPYLDKIRMEGQLLFYHFPAIIGICYEPERAVFFIFFKGRWFIRSKQRSGHVNRRRISFTGIFFTQLQIVWRRTYINNIGNTILYISFQSILHIHLAPLDIFFIRHKCCKVNCIGPGVQPARLGKMHMRIRHPGH